MFFRNLLHRLTAAPLRRGKAFARDERGVTAIEFGLLAIPFFALVGGTMETGVVSLAGQILDSAVQDSSRLIRTGQAENANFSETLFRDAICDRLHGLFDCDALRVNVSVITNFSGAALGPPVDVSGNWTLPAAYDDGGGDSIVLVRAYYKWPTMLDIGGFSLADQPDGTRLLGAVRVFRNEPF
jgi:Flp pilus assembly protein TadG